MLEERMKIINYLDAYNPLLTEHQKETMGLYYLQDLSLGEISDNMQISRQAVHDVIKRTTKALIEYEKKLGVVKKQETTKKHLSNVIDNLETGLPKQVEYAMLMLKKIRDDF
ncbi:DNA-binding protein [Clostridia bacterium]|nr:DNA-binding protein [Clostridia bacterium]